MSLRARLPLFFALLVVVPMVALALVLLRPASDGEEAGAEAAVAAHRGTAVALAQEARAGAARLAGAVARDEALVTAFREDRRDDADRRADALLRTLGLKRIVIVTAGGVTAVDAGSRTAILSADRPLPAAGGQATLRVSTQGPKAYAATVRRITGLEVVVRLDDRLLAATSAVLGAARLPAPGEKLRAGGRRYRLAGFTAPDAPGSTLRVTLAAPATTTGVREAPRTLVAVGLAFLLLAAGLAVLVARDRRRRVGELRAAAHSVATGDFAATVPTRGRDELAALGADFNRMAAELGQRDGEGRAERERLADATRRVGEAFDQGLPRDAVLTIVLRNAVDGSRASAGRVGMRKAAAAPVRKVAEEGAVTGLEAALWTAEEAALSSGAPADAHRDGAAALAHPLVASAAGPRTVGVVSVARRGPPFGPAERELVASVTRQAAIALDTAALHETVERQAVTDELTGLATRRRFQEALAKEFERARRFGAPLALVLLDVDDVKAVNDTYGHQVGDLVLREVGRVLRAASRELDTPARYGGQELAIVLPGTDLEGAYNLAERVRAGVEALRLPGPGGDGLRVTASFGAATHPESAADEHELLRAADSALHDAKRAGKNRTVRAARVPLG